MIVPRHRNVNFAARFNLDRIAYAARKKKIGGVGWRESVELSFIIFIPQRECKGFF